MSCSTCSFHDMCYKFIVQWKHEIVMFAHTHYVLTCNSLTPNDCLDHDCQYCLEQLLPCRANQVDVDVAVFTNILKDKVDEFGGIEAYLEAQNSLFSKIKDPQSQCLVVNIDGRSVSLLWVVLVLLCLRQSFEQHLKPWHRQVCRWHIPCSPGSA